MFRKRRIKRIQGRLWGLLPVIRRHVYHPHFRGSFSIKDVLPALIPRLSYADMEVSEGGEAGLAYDLLVRGNLGTAQRRCLKDALRKYCKQDTLAMVELSFNSYCAQGVTLAGSANFWSSSTLSW